MMMMAMMLVAYMMRMVSFVVPSSSGRIMTQNATFTKVTKMMMINNQY